jgi:hypothetical protein
MRHEVRALGNTVAHSMFMWGVLISMLVSSGGTRQAQVIITELARHDATDCERS